jgi:hypothetical protein
MAERRWWLRIRDDCGSGYVTTGAEPESKFSFFSGVVESLFCRGFLQKRGAERGFLMVKSWWNAGERWSENDLKSASKNTPSFRIFFGLSRFGKARATLNVLVRTIYIPTFAKCAKVGAPDHLLLSQGWATRRASLIETYPLEKAGEAYARTMSGYAQFCMVLTM